MVHCMIISLRMFVCMVLYCVVPIVYYDYCVRLFVTIDCRLQLKPGLFWYRHDPQMHEMVSDGSSLAEIWTTFRKKSMRVFFCSKHISKT